MPLLSRSARMSLAVPVLVGFWLWPAAASESLGASLPARQQQSEQGAAPLTRSDCADCHDEADEFPSGTHGRAMARVSQEMLDGSCTACHGAGAEHIDDPLPENIVRFPGDQACATCHNGSDGQLWLANPAHERHDVACLDCHGEGHQEPMAEPLLLEEPFDLCGSCHGTPAGSFYRPFAHRNGSEPFACTECHSAHGLERVGRLLQGTEDGACLDCHSELAGPFVFEHPPHTVDGCSSCHQPHGSANPRQLVRRSVLSLCLECHADVPAFHDLTQARFRNCTTCHVAVHGSNRNPHLFDD